MKQQFLEDKTGTIRLTAYTNNLALIPADSVKITLYKPDGSELQAQASANRNATTGEMTYTLTTTHTADHDLNYKALWEYTISGVTYYQTQLFDVVKSMLSIPITDDDLYNELESLRKQNRQATGTATAGSSNSLTDTTRNEEDDFWNGGKLKIISGTGSNQERTITDFVQSTGVFTVGSSGVGTWTTSPSTDSVYLAVKSFTSKIQAAFNRLETMLYNKGKRDSLILESSQIEVPLIYLTIHMIALDFMDEQGDKWDRLSNTYLDKFNLSFNSMKLEYDEDESGAIVGEDEEQQGAAELRIGRS